MLAITYTMERKRITAAKWGITQTKKETVEQLPFWTNKIGKFRVQY